MSSDKSGKTESNKPKLQKHDRRSDKHNGKDRNPSKSRREGWTEQGVRLDPTRRID